MSNLSNFIVETKDAWNPLNEGIPLSDSEAAEIITDWFEYLMLIQDFVEKKRYYK
ncbi:MAG: hypothetical protein ACK481_10615 [Candidatus Melainabacteria bacterium]|jgi:hypothetical protein